MQRQCKSQFSTASIAAWTLILKIALKNTFVNHIISHDILYLWLWIDYINALPDIFPHGSMFSIMQM